MEITSRFTNALTFTCRLHARQRRKLSGVPYVGHLLRVAGLVVEQGADEDEAIAALLHDAIEDQGGPAARTTIRRRFGEPVAALVDECSDTNRNLKPPWRDRKEAHLQRLATASAAARRIVAADKLDNVRGLALAYREHGEALWERFSGGREGTLWYFRRAAEVLQQAGPDPLAAELGRAVVDLEKLVTASRRGKA